MQKDLMAIKSARLDPHRILYNTFPPSQCESLHGIIIEKIESNIILSILLIFIMILRFVTSLLLLVLLLIINL